jgi:hypothetical protein
MFGFGGAPWLKNLASGGATNANLAIGTTESAAFSPDGNVLGSLSLSEVLHLWRAPSWAEIEAAETAEAKTP